MTASIPRNRPPTRTDAAPALRTVFRIFAAWGLTDREAMIVLGLAHWCGHCQAEVPRLQEWFDDNGMPDDVDVVALATGSSSSQPNFPPGEWLVREGWSVPTLVDDEASTGGTAYGVQGFPAFVVVDADGDVVQRASGELTVEQWEQLLEAARSGEPSPV